MLASRTDFAARLQPDSTPIGRRRERFGLARRNIDAWLGHAGSSR